MGKRREGREFCLHALYLWDNFHMSPEEVWKIIVHSAGTSSLDFAKILFEGTCREKEKLDEVIQRHCHNWKLSRMASVDRNILRLAAYEILSMPETPPKVIINEAVDIAKKFSTEESGKFVNGILDKLKAERPA